MQLQLTASPRKFLQVLLWLRTLAVIGQSAAIGVAHQWLAITLPVAAMLGVVAALAAIALLTGLRMRIALPVTQLELTIQLLIDITALTMLLHLSGGTSNPFASLYLIPIALAAVGLGWQYTVMITLACLGCYLWLIDHFTALRPMHMNLANVFNLHLMGMHVTFALSTMLLAVALSIMAAEMRHRDQTMAALREDAMRQEHLSAMGVLAVGTAHALSTPLFSMAMLVSELRAARKVDQGFRDDLSLLDRQIQLCKDKLTTLLHAAGQPRGPQTHTVPVQTALQEALNNWSLVRPAVHLQVKWQALTGNPLVTVDDGFSEALASLLDNAADASASRGSDIVKVTTMDDKHGLRVCIDDEGHGLDTNLQRQAGKAVFTTKPGGFGLGLVLCHANLNRLNGAVTLSRRPEGGTRTTITMPVHMREIPSGGN